MKGKLIKFSIVVSFAFSLVVLSCVEPYNPAVIQEDVRYLIVDGFLNSSEGSVTVTLSRTQPLYDAAAPPPESNAAVTLEEEDGSGYLLREKEGGLYDLSGLTIDAGKKYRLHIRTANNEEYRSEYITIKTTPAIDSVFWVPESDGIQIYVNSHDATGNSRFYRWDYVETYEYTAAFSSLLKLVDGEILPRPEDESLYHCWRDIYSTNILVGSSGKLQQDVISYFPLAFIPRGNKKLSKKYSILVRQQAITEEAYDYWLQLKQTTESLGGLFDPMPSQITGNLYNTSNTAQPVIGYFSGGTIREERIFIEPIDLPDHLRRFPASGCVMDTIPVDEIQDYGNSILLISSYGNPFVEGYLTANTRCIDCRVQGGVTTKPSFWED